MIIKIKSIKYGIKKVLIDIEDWNKIKDYKWCLSYNKLQNNFYITTQKWNKKEKKYNNFRLHRIIMNCPKNLLVDHINRNPLDNRKCNLRICTKQENQRNRIKGKNKKSTIFKGVWTLKKTNKYYASICNNYKVIYLGGYKTEIEAAKAYNEAAIKYHGKFARLNEI